MLIKDTHYCIQLYSILLNTPLPTLCDASTIISVLLVMGEVAQQLTWKRTALTAVFPLSAFVALFYRTRTAK